MTNVKKTTGKYKTIKAIAYVMFALGLGYSVFHIFDFFLTTLQSTLATALIVPAFIDGMQLVGRIMRSKDLSAATRNRGKWFQGFGAIASLVANVVAGDSIGDRVGGAIIVIGYIAVEAAAESIRPASDDTAAERKAKAAADRAARKAKADADAARKARQAEGRRERDRQRREQQMRDAEIAALNAKMLADSAPISPAPMFIDDIVDQAPIASCANTYL